MIIEQKFDHRIEEKDIRAVLEPANSTESDDDSVIAADSQPTKMIGVLAPLIMINSTQIEMTDVISMRLDSNGILPTLSLLVQDTYGLLSSVDMASADNLVIVEVIPPFDGIYKKIKLYFYITSAVAYGDSEKVSITGIYKLPGIYSSQLKSYGLISTYKFVEQMAMECKLGLASNIEDTNDERYIYMNNSNPIDTIEKCVATGGSPFVILDFWVDFWNNLNIVDVYDRFNAKDDGLKMWVGQMNVDTESTNDNIQNEPYEIDALITNDPDAQNLPTYTKTYNISNSIGGNVFDGTDKVLTTFDRKMEMVQDTLVQDGNVNNDIFTKYFYIGETIGDNTDYIKQPIIRSSFLNKMRTTTYNFVLPKPAFGLMRGHRVNVKWYESDMIKKDIMKDNDSLVDNTTDFQDDPENVTDQDGIVLNKKISGQYLIIGTSIDFKNEGGDLRFTQTLTLTTSENTTSYGKGLDYNNE